VKPFIPEVAMVRQDRGPVPLLEVRGISKSFGAVAAVAGVSFPRYAGEAHALVGENGAGKSTIDPVSVDTGNRQRDQHITSADFLDVENHPQIEFTSTEVRDFDGETFILVGELTLHGVTRTVELEAEFLGVVDDPSGAERTGFSATTTISRAAFGVDIQLGFGAGNVVVADTIEIAIEIEFTSTGPDPR
jgi:polyisoprenoid-binding protein YceI